MSNVLSHHCLEALKVTDIWRQFSLLNFRGAVTKFYWKVTKFSPKNPTLKLLKMNHATLKTLETTKMFADSPWKWCKKSLDFQVFHCWALTNESFPLILQMSQYIKVLAQRWNIWKSHTWIWRVILSLNFQKYQGKAESKSESTHSLVFSQ